MVSPAYAVQIPWNISAQQMDALKNTMYHANRGKWDDAELFAKRSKDPTILKIVDWAQYYNGSSANFLSIAQFVDANPGWPDQMLLRRRAEDLLEPGLSSEYLLKWFTEFPPVTAKGMQYFAEAKIDKGHKDNASRQEIDALIKKAWIDGNFTQKDEKDFLLKHSGRLTQADHNARISRLLWNERIEQAQRIMSRADAGHQKLFDARIKLIRGLPGVEAAVQRVPGNLTNDQGFLYDRIRWRERKGLDAGVQELLLLMPVKPQFPDKWWQIKQRQARELIDEKQYQKAYRLVNNHHLERGADFADAEWLSGWIALRKLHDANSAYKHFYTLHKSVSMPVSLARAAYWAGRAADANKNPKIAQDWYKVAAKYPQTFYGQMALLKGVKPTILRLPPPPTVTGQDVIAFSKNDAAKVAYMLMRLGGEDERARRFISQALLNTKTVGESYLIANMARSMQNNELSVVATKEGTRFGEWHAYVGYPVIDAVKGAAEQKAFSLAIIRQESEFKKAAFSRVGAQGYMQLMPATAQQMAKELGLPFNRQRLSTDANYNVAIGSHYLQKMVRHYDNSYVLAIASYNAGPGNVNKWLNSHGDPRQKATAEEVIDWIEAIPFAETRNYVQRVLEGLQVYRATLQTSKSAPLMLGQDLVRASNKALATAQ